VLESSEVEVSFKADQALDQLTLDLGDGKSAQLSAGPDQWYHYRTQATESFSLTASAVNTSKFANKHKPTCRISVYEDQAPTLKLSAPDELDILPGEKVKVAFEASDDFGIAKAEIEVTTTKADGETSTQNIPIALDGEAGKKKVQKSIDLDPKAMGLKHGDQLSYVVRVTDTKAKKTEGSDADAKPPGQSSPKDGELAKNNAPSKNDAEAAEQLPGEPKDDAGQKSEAESGGEKPEEEKTANEKSGIPSALAKAGEPKSSKPKEDQGSKPPGNEMALRALDCGQSCECSPKNIKVDEWAGSFEGDKRRKLEIAIDPVLKLLDSLLVKAGEQTDPLKSPAATEEGLQETHTGPLEAAKGFLKESITVTADLKSRTNGTPYAFAGLQVHNIGQAHVLPAQTNLAAVAISAPAPNENGAQVDQASLHILRAREMLAALTRSYETVKREQKVADAMQKIQKMYQIFIEDTQALLVSKKGAINSYDRKIAEVDDDYVEKLKALMEEKKKIMDELAKVLGEDPRMLRRYLAMQNLQATSYRDQMTLLAERQKEVTSQVSEWNASPEKERAALSKKLEQTFAPRQRQVVEEAVKMHENMETWLPLDIKPDHDKVQELLQRAGKVVQFASESTGEKRQHASANVLEELYLLRTSLPGVAQIESKDQAKLTAYVANRLEEVESLITTQSGQMRTMESLAKGDFAKAAEIVQQRIAVETTTLGEKIDTTKKQVSPMSAEIATKAEALDKVVQGDILPPQKASIEHLAGTNIKAAGEKLDAIVPAFALAENTFDELMRLIIAKLDEAPAGGSPGSAPDMESILAMLQNEMKAKDSLGIPCRPTNVMMMTDWMKPGEGKGQGQGREMAQAQAKAAQAQAKKDQSESEKLGKEARDRAKKAMAEADKLASATAVVPPPPNDTKRRSDAWNKLASRLEKDLLQGRDNTPPEQYRAAIESYFQAISGSTSEVSK
jgi:hypothetical protein